MDESVPDLEDVFGELASQFATLIDQERGGIEFTFTRDNLPVSPSTVATDRFWSRGATWHVYNNLPVPAVDLCIDKLGCRLLALLILSVVFHPEPARVDVQLRHHPSRIKTLRVEHEPWPQRSGLYLTTPESFSYATKVADRHPMVGEPMPELPVIEIVTHSGHAPLDMSEWSSQCDTIVGFGGDRAAVRMAQFLLDASLNSNEQDEFDLEGEAGGYRCVGIGSTELRVYLPSALGYIDQDY